MVRGTESNSNCVSMNFPVKTYDSHTEEGNL